MGRSRTARGLAGGRTDRRPEPRANEGGAFSSWPALLLSLLAVLPGAVATPEPTADVPTEPSVPEVLERIAREADPAANPFLNDRRAELLRRQLEAVDELPIRLRLQWELSAELLYAGRNRECLDELDRLRQTLERPDVDAAPALFDQLDERRAIAWMRLGEQANCVARHSASACILPLAGEAIHRDPEGSRRAAETLDVLLARSRPTGERVWLRNLAAMTLGEHPEGVPERFRIDPSFFASDLVDFPVFPNRAGEAGVAVEGLAGGVVLEDLDGDLDLDLVVSSWGLEDPLRSFRNRGDGTFEETTASAGLAGQVGGLNLVHGDADGDGDPDVLVLRGAWLGPAGHHPASLLLNDGAGRFRDATREAGLYFEAPSHSAAFADYDGDGHLDLFVGHESTPGDRLPSRLYRNLGDGRFEDVAARVGADVVGLVKGVAWGDVDDDGDPDLYLSLFEGRNVLLRNEGEEGRWGDRFVDVTERAGVAEPRQSFATWFWDWDQDGREDLFVAPFPGFYSANVGLLVSEYLRLPYEVERARLYLNQGGGTFEDVAARVGLDTTLLAMGAGWGDLDQDGDPDAYLGTGEPSLSTLVPNRMFLSDGSERLLDVSEVGGFAHLQKGHGIAFGDVDLDGDVDVYAVLGGAYSGDLARNALFVNPGFGRSWVGLELEGRRVNRGAIGARVEVVVVGPDGRRRSIHRTVGPRGSFGSGPLRLELGLGDAEEIERVEVRWPSPAGTRSTHRGISPGRFWRLVEGEPAARARTPSSSAVPEVAPASPVNRTP